MRSGACAIAIFFAVGSAHADDSDKVKVEVRGDADAFLEQATLGHFPEIEWKTLCATPCTVYIAGSATVRATAHDLPSKPITLEAHDTILRVHVPPAEGAASGNTLIVFGSIVLAYSAIALPIGIGLELSEMCFLFCGNARPDHTTADWFAASGAITAVAGATLLGVGFSMKNDARAKLSMSSRGAALTVVF